MSGWKLEATNQVPAEGRRVSESMSETSELALPNDANPLGYLIGGRLMHLVDIGAAIAASLAATER